MQHMRFTRKFSVIRNEMEIDKLCRWTVKSFSHFTSAGGGNVLCKLFLYLFYERRVRSMQRLLFSEKKKASYNSREKPLLGCVHITCFLKRGVNRGGCNFLMILDTLYIVLHFTSRYALSCFLKAEELQWALFSRTLWCPIFVVDLKHIWRKEGCVRVVSWLATA